MTRKRSTYRRPDPTWLEQALFITILLCCSVLLAVFLVDMITAASR